MSYQEFASIFDTYAGKLRLTDHVDPLYNLIENIRSALTNQKTSLCKIFDAKSLYAKQNFTGDLMMDQNMFYSTLSNKLR